MSELIYLLLKDESGTLENEIVLLATARKQKEIESGVFEALEIGDTYADLRRKYSDFGAGVTRLKNGVECWYLPFFSHPQMITPNPLHAELKTAEEIRSYGWDIIEENEY